MNTETVSDAEQAALIQNLKDLGLYEYESGEITLQYHDLVSTLSEAVISGVPLGRLPGMVNTGINIISKEAWEKVPPGKALACAFAGTNWIVSLVEKKEDGTITIKELRKRIWKEGDKNYTIDELAGLMAKEIDLAVLSTGTPIEDIRAIGIAFGFAQDNINTEKGIDARLTKKSDSKGWHFLETKSDSPALDRPSLGMKLLENLKNIPDRNWTVEHFAFRNDTHGVAEHGQTFPMLMLPVGFVWGTGDNAAFGTYNFELGQYLISSDPILERMRRLNMLPDPNFIMEYLMGGNYIKYRAAAAMQLLSEDMKILSGYDIADALIRSKDEAIMSRLAQANDVTEIKKYLNLPVLSDTEAWVVHQAAAVALRQAGQLMGLSMSAVASVAGYQPGTRAAIPVEGGVYWKGYGVQEAARSAMNTAVPGQELEIVKASGMIGVGVTALVQTLYG